MFGRTLGGATVATIQGLIVFGLTFLFGFHVVRFAFLPLAILFMFLIALLFTALGTAIASMLDDMQGFQLIINFLVMPLFFLSGALFPLQGLPAVINDIATIDPLSYGIDGVRGALTGVFHFGLGTDLGVLLVVTTIFIGIGSYLFSKVQI